MIVIKYLESVYNGKFGLHAYEIKFSDDEAMNYGIPKTIKFFTEDNENLKTAILFYPEFQREFIIKRLKCLAAQQKSDYIFLGHYEEIDDYLITRKYDAKRVTRWYRTGIYDDYSKEYDAQTFFDKNKDSLRDYMERKVDEQPDCNRGKNFRESIQCTSKMDDLQEIIQKFPKGEIIEFGNNEGRARVATNLINYRGYNYIIADLIEEECKGIPYSCFSTGKMYDGIVIIFRKKTELIEMGFNEQERMAIYCHELGHGFSTNQQRKKSPNERDIGKEIDSDIFAVRNCGISPYILKSALEKTREYALRTGRKELEAFYQEMDARIGNCMKLIEEYEKNKKIPGFIQ